VTRRQAPAGGRRRYPRTARVNHLLQEVIAESLERLADSDERLRLVTVTAVDCDPDLRHATVWLASLDTDEADALADARVRLQAAVSRQVRMKRTPQLAFSADPAVAHGQRVEDILRRLGQPEEP
jgi:ribosome-binding factor A